MKRNKLLFRLVLSYTVLVGLVLCGFFIIESYNYIEVIFKEKQTAYEQKLDIVLEQLNDNIQKIYTLHSDIVKVPQLRQTVEYEEMNNIEAKDVLSALRAKHAGVVGIYLYNEEGEILEYAANTLEAIPVFAELQDFITSKAYRRFSFQNENLIYYGAFYLPDNNYEYKGYIAVVLKPERFVYNMRTRAEETFDGLYFMDDGVIVDRYPEEIAVIPEEQFIELKGGALLQIGDEPYMVFVQRNRKYAEWEHVAIVNYGEYAKEVWNLVMILAAWLIAAIICIVIVSYITSKKITKPILQVTRAMTKVEKGDYPPPLASHSRDETDELIQGFNHMVKSLEKLNDDVAREQEEKRKYEVEKVNAQMELLQSQVNPHFIHNTLNGLKYMALSAGNRELAATITSFNTLLRASISTNTEYTTVEEECRYAMEYMNIQKMRYATREITCTSHIDPQASNALLPRLILQPLVENSLLHGILPMEGRNGQIKIFCMLDPDFLKGFLHVYITDNGIGITEEKLKMINRGELKVTNGYNHVGLNNVKDRLNLLYQTECKFIIASEYQVGTTIYFCVPYKEEE